MEKFKQYKYIIIILLIVLGFTFYWYEWRPSQIRKQCWIKTKEIIKDEDVSTLNVQRILEICTTGQGLK